MSLRHDLARAIRRWHARLGVAAALFFGLLVVTGIALNHSESLGLAHISVRSPLLAQWLGLPRPVVLQIVELDAPFVATPNLWLYRGRRLPDGGGPLLGAAVTGALLAVATPDRIVLYTPEGERIDTLAGDALPGLPLAAFGVEGDRLVVRTPRGIFASPDGLDWQPHPPASVHWSHALTPDRGQAARAARQLVPALPLERIVLDLHAGRFFGRHGPWLVDAAAVILLLLACSGLWIQWRGWRRRKEDPRTRTRRTRRPAIP